LDELIFKFKTRGLPASSVIAEARQEFKSYQYQPELQPWTEKIAEQSLQSNGKNVPKISELVTINAELHS
jgi:hypothetical protein